MDEAETNAIETNMAALCSAIESEMFATFLRIKSLLKRNECELIKLEFTNEAKVLKIFDFLMLKKGSWEATIEFLQKHKFIDVAAKLNLSAGRLADSVALQLESLQVGQSSSDWRQFIRDVTDFYLGDYRVVESFDVDGDSDLIESVWVDLQLEGSREPIDDYREIFAQMRAKNCRLAIVRGQPGSGKTTLVKKIAYDWAKEGKTEIFDLVLAIPLREVQSKSDLLEMAVGFHLGNDDDAEAKRICADLRREKLKVLLMLDGLDEFQVPTDSPLSNMFCPAPNNFSVVQTKRARFDFDLLITSRPFACQLIHANIAAVMYEIVGFDEVKQVEFVEKRCKKPEGKSKAIEHLSQSNCLKEISQNPFLLTLICFLSDLNDSIPSTLTKLYGTFLHRMLIRAARKNAVGKDFDPSNWQQSELLKNLCSLALLGVINNCYQFNKSETQMCHVKFDDFHSGLIHFRSNPVGLALKCDFPHRSIQDFLAAFYAVHYWGDKTITEATGWPDDIWSGPFADLIPPMKSESLMAQFGLIGSDSQFCRFFFGLLSGKIDFSDRFRATLSHIIGHFTFVLFDPLWLLFVGSDVADCSDEENFNAGMIANDLADLYVSPHHLQPTELEERKFRFDYGRTRKWRGMSVAAVFEQLTDAFRRGYKLTRISDKSDSYSVGSDNPQHLKILYLDVADENIMEDIGKLLPFSCIGHLHVQMTSVPQRNTLAIQRILTQIPAVASVCIEECCQPSYFNLIIRVEAKQVVPPKCFSVKNFIISDFSEIGRKMLAQFQAVTHFQQEVINVLSVEQWQSISNFSVAIMADNSMSNVDIWNAIKPD